MVMLLDGAEQRDLRIRQIVGHSGLSCSAPAFYPIVIRLALPPAAAGARVSGPIGQSR